MPKLERDGVEIHYEEQGSGPAILLTHGFGETSRMWRGQVEALRSTHRVVTWDLRGHGLSDSPADPSLYSMQKTLEDMLALLDHCGIDQAVLAGHSMGGYATLALHLRRPERCKALVLFGTGPGFRADPAREKWNAYARSRGEGIEQRGLAELGPDAEGRAEEHRDVAGLVHAAKNMLIQHDASVIDSLTHIAVPTLVVVGQKDAGFVAGSEYMASKIPGSIHCVIPDAGHAANLHQPEAFNTALHEFLDGLVTA